MKIAILLLGCLLCFWPSAARAAYVTTAELERSCLSSKREQVNGCLQYIAGVIDYHILMQSFGTAPTIDFCLPANLTLEDAGVAVMRYLRRHPQHDAFIASSAVPLALNEAFPCRPKPPKVTATKKKRKR